MRARLRVDRAENDSLGDRIEEVLIPKRGGHLWIITRRRASLASFALFEVFGILALPDTFRVPEVFQEHFRAIHELLPVGRIEGDSASGPAKMRAILPSLINDHAQIELPVDRLELGHGLVVVQAENVHRARDLELRGQIEEQVEPQVLQRCGLFVRVGVLIVFPSDCNDRFSEGEAPKDLGLAIVLSKDAKVLACVRLHEWALICGQSLLIGPDELLSSVDKFRV